MQGIKNIIYEIDGQVLSFINIGEKIQIKYKDISSIISEEKFFKYLEKFFCIIDNWDKEYINTNVIDGNNWKLSIIYSNSDEKEYRGKSSFPNNFEAFERLNQELIVDVRNG